MLIDIFSSNPTQLVARNVSPNSKNMRRTVLLFISILSLGLISNIQSQIISGQVVYSELDKYESIYGATIYFDTTYVVSDMEGKFCTNILRHYPKSIIFKGSTHASLMIFNLPQDYDTLKFDKIELLEHAFISKAQYDSIQGNLIKTFKENDLLIIQQRKADVILRSKYKGVYCWADLLGYEVLDSLENKYILNPFDHKTKIIFDFDSLKDIITLDYEKIKK